MLKINLRNFSSQLSSIIHLRNTSTSSSTFFWSKCKKHIKPSSSSIHAFINQLGVVVKDKQQMCDVAADFYENFFKKSEIVRPHPYTDSPKVEFDNGK